MGSIIEKFQRSFKMQAILGGSEEIMCDFAMRQAMKQAYTSNEQAAGTSARL
jgi:Na+/alanine symporter